MEQEVKWDRIRKGLRAEKGQGGLPPAFRMRMEAQTKWAQSASLVVGDVKHYSK